MHSKKLLLATLIAIVMIFILLFDVHHYLTLEYLKSSKDKLDVYFQDNPLLVFGTYFVIYLASTAFSLPGAAVLSLAGGALFGLTAGTLVLSLIHI